MEGAKCIFEIQLHGDMFRELSQVRFNMHQHSRGSLGGPDPELATSEVGVKEFTGLRQKQVVDEFDQNGTHTYGPHLPPPPLSNATSLVA